MRPYIGGMTLLRNKQASYLFGHGTEAGTLVFPRLALQRQRRSGAYPPNDFISAGETLPASPLHTFHVTGDGPGLCVFFLF